MEVHGATGVGSVTSTEIRMRVCDDSGYSLTVLVSEHLSRAGRRVAATTFERRRPAPKGGCRAYTLSWKLAWSVQGAGRYTLTFVVRDWVGLTSPPVSRSYVITR